MKDGNDYWKAMKYWWNLKSLFKLFKNHSLVLLLKAIVLKAQSLSRQFRLTSVLHHVQSWVLGKLINLSCLIYKILIMVAEAQEKYALKCLIQHLTHRMCSVHVNCYDYLYYHDHHHCLTSSSRFRNSSSSFWSRASCSSCCNRWFSASCFSI